MVVYNKFRIGKSNRKPFAVKIWVWKSINIRHEIFFSIFRENKEENNSLSLIPTPVSWFKLERQFHINQSIPLTSTVFIYQAMALPVRIVISRQMSACTLDISRAGQPEICYGFEHRVFYIRPVNFELYECVQFWSVWERERKCHGAISGAKSISEQRALRMLVNLCSTY